jgi:hypothetical protein
MTSNWDEEAFDSELQQILEKKPPISATRIKAIASLALSNVKVRVAKLMFLQTRILMFHSPFVARCRRLFVVSCTFAHLVFSTSNSSFTRSRNSYRNAMRCTKSLVRTTIFGASNRSVKFFISTPCVRNRSLCDGRHYESVSRQAGCERSLR